MLQLEQKLLDIKLDFEEKGRGGIVLIVVAESNREFINCCKQHNLVLGSTIHVNPIYKPSWNRLQGLRATQIIYWGTRKNAIPVELRYELKVVMGETAFINYHGLFCPFNKNELSKECFEMECPYLRSRIGVSICGYFEKQKEEGVEE